jgi:uncharacterized protein YndB with AHSA1/START domain
MSASRISLDETVQSTIEIAAPPERVFDALTDPEELAGWLGPNEELSHDWSVDLRPGGSWRARTTDGDGRDGSMHGTYLVVDRPRRLELTWNDQSELGESRVRFDLVPADVAGVPGTRLTVTHQGIGVQAMSASHVPFGVPHIVHCLVRMTALSTHAGPGR